MRIFILVWPRPSFATKRFVKQSPGARARQGPFVRRGPGGSFLRAKFEGFLALGAPVGLKGPAREGGALQRAAPRLGLFWLETLSFQRKHWNRTNIFQIMSLMSFLYSILRHLCISLRSSLRGA